MSKGRQPYQEGDLLPAQAKAVELMLTTPKLSDVAAEVGVARETLWRWLKHDARFRLRLSERETEELAAVARKLVSLCGKAVTTLEIALNGHEVGREALRASDICLRRIVPILEASALHVRLSDLERRLSQLGFEVS